MKFKTKFLAFILLLFNVFAYGQIDQYNYQRELSGIKDQWHTLRLSDEIFGKVSNNLNDIRIFGYTNEGDTVEAPYLINLKTEKISNNDISFQTINTSHNEKGYYFTFEIPTNEPINQIKLDFTQKNFDWRIKLEGSQNQQEWFTIIENYRILSIYNELIDFQFTKLSFPESKYPFFRLFIESIEKPNLSAVKISQYKIEEGNFKTYPIKNSTIEEKKQAKATEINMELSIPVSVCQIKISIKDTFDFYRPITIQYLSDSIKTEKGWIYNYTTLTNGTLNSLEQNKFIFDNRIAKNLKIIIHNGDNQPLQIDNLEVKGYVYELIARFTEPATYFLSYGNNNATKPNYDIDRFTKNIPATLTSLNLGIEQKIDKKASSLTEPLFKNKNWLWAIMAVIILLLGWFSLKMIRKN